MAFIENGSWAPMACKVMKEKLSGCKNLTFAETAVHIKSAMNAANKDEIAALAEELCQNYQALSSETANKNDMTALFKIGYGLYVVTSNDGKKDNGLIVNTVAQVTSQPNRVAVTINKMNYSHHVIEQTGIMNLNILSEEAPFSVFENFGFQSGRTADKFAGETLTRSDNGLVMLRKYVNAVMSLKVIQHIDLGTHGMFICDVTEARVISNAPSMTYAFYHAHVKPRPATEGKKGFVPALQAWRSGFRTHTISNQKRRRYEQVRRNTNREEPAGSFCRRIPSQEQVYLLRLQGQEGRVRADRRSVFADR